MKQTVALIILDGWGYSTEHEHNAIAQANTPTYDVLLKKYPSTFLEASGPAVGLPEGQMGNSEVGHTTIGAGRSLDTDLVRIGKALADGRLKHNPAWQALVEHSVAPGKTLHLIGLTSSGGVHSHLEHLKGILRELKAGGISRVALHLITDGRDAPPQAAEAEIAALEAELEALGIGWIASISGRYFAMDRDNNWDRLARFEKALFECEGKVCTLKPSAWVSSEYQNGLTSDEYLEPAVLKAPDGSVLSLNPGDSVLCFNFRSDRMRMLLERLVEKKQSHDLFIATMTEYHPEYPVAVLFPPERTETSLAAEISQAGLTQMHIAETEKYPHATYFLNGGKNEPYPGEVHELIPSRKDVATHDQAPEMRAREITDKALEYVGEVDFIFINYANPDIVGHTANEGAIIKAVETVDGELARIVEALEKSEGSAIITADHGNAEQNIDPSTGAPHTAHTTNPVQCIVTKSGARLKPAGTLADLAPTVLTLLALPTPKTMTGQSLLSAV